jgi:molybdopterin molybdotransferase
MSAAPPPTSSRHALEQAAAWIDANVQRLGAEDVPLPALAGRVLAAEIVATSDEPACARAAIDGFAVRADETVGASTYNPLAFRIVGPDAPVPPQGVARLNAGDPLPPGTDAVVPFDHVHVAGTGTCEIIEATPPGHDVEPARSEFARGTQVASAGRVVTPADLGLLALAGVASASAVRRPRVELVLTGRDVAPNAGRARDTDGPVLRALIERDGGDVADTRRIGRDHAALREAFAVPGLDAIIVAGGTGRGPDDATVSTLAELGDAAVRDVALSPGGTAALGRAPNGAVALLLPGRPAACLWSYELIASRAIRRLAGRDTGLPFASRTMALARKIVSAIGVTEIFPVSRIDDGRVEPVTTVARDSLMALAEADGFVIVPESSEGFPTGAAVTVYLLRPIAP